MQLFEKMIIFLAQFLAIYDIILHIIKRLRKSVNETKLNKLEKKKNMLESKFQDIISQLNKNEITELVIRFDLTNPQIETFGNALKENNSLKSLRISDSTMATTDLLAEKLAEVLLVNTTLAKLLFVFDGITSVGVRKIADSLKKNETLTELWFTQSHIGDDGAEAIADALKVNKSIKILSLGDGNISDKGATALAKALKINSTLEEILIVHNPLTEKSVKCFADSLKFNTSLVELSLPRNIPEDLLNRIVPQLVMNQTIKKLLEENKFISTVLMNGIFKLINFKFTIKTETELETVPSLFELAQKKLSLNHITCPSLAEIAFAKVEESLKARKIAVTENSLSKTLQNILVPPTDDPNNTVTRLSLKNPYATFFSSGKKSSMENGAVWEIVPRY